jgi:hypothetical protein
MVWVGKGDKGKALDLLQEDYRLHSTLLGSDFSYQKGFDCSRSGYRTSARMRTGAVDPPANFAGATMATAPLEGMRSRLATLVRR